ncbi:MAG: ROK family protein, partial [Actinomycetota bacterium]|nr:ROK family protein [Actinomycetota bacterium]
MTLPPLPAEALVLAVDVGGTTIKVEVVGGHGDVLASGVDPTPSGEDALTAVVRLGRALIDEVEGETRGPVSRAGVVMPGIVDRARGVGVFSANIGWRDLA